MAAYVATIFLHGGALVYGSQEVGYEKPINFFHYVAVDWNAHPDLYKEYQTLIGIYNDNPALRKGELKKLKGGNDEDVIFFQKSLDNDKFVVVVNVRNKVQKIAPPKGIDGTDLINKQKVSSGEVMVLQPYEYKIIKLN